MLAGSFLTSMEENVDIPFPDTRGNILRAPARVNSWIIIKCDHSWGAANLIDNDYTVKGKWRDHLVKEVEVEELIAESRRNGTHLKSLSWHVQFLSFSSLHRLSLTVYASVIKVKGGQQLTALVDCGDDQECTFPFDHLDR